MHSPFKDTVAKSDECIRYITEEEGRTESKGREAEERRKREGENIND